MQEIDGETRKQLNNLARHKTIIKLLEDIVFDFKVCELEGWDYKEYPTMLKVEIDNIYNKMIRKEV